VPRAVTHGPAFVAALRTRQSTATVIDGDGLDEVSAPVLIRCLGPYEFVVNGTRLDLSGLRPQARLLLRLLSVHTVDGMREERLIGAIWPDTPAHLSRHRLHVAMSSVRRLLRRQTGPLPIDVVRHEDTYVLRLPEGSQVDLLLFEEAVRRWRTGGGMVARDESVEFGLRALRLYRGDLLGADVGADLSVVERDHLRTEAATIATMLSMHALDRGDIGAVVPLCRRGLQIDELNEQLWHLMAQAQRRIGNQAAARRAQRTYEDLFADGAGDPVISDRTTPFR
jgi:DNA-binding SARP family transcriptional activator